MSLLPRNLLVTGGAGFIGANFVHYWLREHPADTVVVLDALTYAGNRNSLRDLDGCDRFHFCHGDIRDRIRVESILRSRSINTLVNFAAESHVDRSIVGPQQTIETNIIGTHALLQACRKVWLVEQTVPDHRFHHVSTDEVYGSLDHGDPGFHERTPYAPNSPYAASKAASDHLVRAYGHTYGLLTTTTNCSNNYGPFQFPEKLIPLAIVNILDGRPIPIYGDGRNIRDWLFVMDHCFAIDKVLCNGRPGETYNVGGRSEIENLELVKKLCDVADRMFCTNPELKLRFPHSPAATGTSTQVLVSFVSDRPGHDRRYAIDDAKIQKELVFAPRTTLTAGLELTFLWFVENEPWWRHVMDGTYREWIDQQYGKSLPK